MSIVTPRPSTPRPWLGSYAEGVPHDIEPQEGSLYDLVRGSVAQYGDHVALEFFGRTTTYTELGEQIERAAEGLRLLGVQKGDPVALVLPNCPQHIVAFYAVLRLGAIVVEHNPLYTPRELRHQFEDHGARVVIAWDKVVDTIQAFPTDVAVTSIVSVDVTHAMPFLTRAMLRLPVAKARESRAALTTRVRGTMPWRDLVASAPIDAHIIAPGPDDAALIQYTSLGSSTRNATGYSGRLSKIISAPMRFCICGWKTRSIQPAIRSSSRAIAVPPA